MKTKIRMIKSANGCDDGIQSKHYYEGEVYDVTDSLAKNFILMNVAEKLEDEKTKHQHENKAITEDEYKNKLDKPNKRKGDKS